MGILDGLMKMASPGCPRCGRRSGGIYESMRGDICPSCNAEMIGTAVSSSGSVQCAEGHSAVNMLPSQRSGSSITFVCPQCRKATRVSRSGSGFTVS